jgi:hypothetical protein
MKTKIKITKFNISERVTRWLAMLPVFLVLMALGVGCENSLMFGDDKNAPHFNSSASNDLMSGSSLPHTNVTELSFPVTVDFALDFYECENNPGPFIYFSGVAATESGFGVRTIFRNNMKGTHEYTVEKNVDVDLLPAGKEIIIPKQPSRGGVGGNPRIYIQFEDTEGNPIGEEIFIGRCVQGSSFKGSQQVDSRALSYVDYHVMGCENSPGPNITFDAGLSISAGLNARIIFRNNEKGTHEAIADVSSTVAQVIPAGMSFTFPKQPVLGGVGGNPWIWTQFTDGNTQAVGDEVLLGRCEQLSKAL